LKPADAVPRWMYEVQSLSRQLGADCVLEDRAVIVTAAHTALRLTEFQTHLLVHVSLLHEARWRSVGLLSVPRAQLPEFLERTLPEVEP
jgi:hypothetical protein